MLLLIAIAALFRVTPLEGQDARAGLSVGYGGGGPVGIVATAGSLDVNVWRAIGITAGIASLDHGNGVCSHRTPSRCDGSARTWAVGAAYTASASERITIRTSITAGGHDFSGIRIGDDEYVRGGSRPLVSGEVTGGVRLIGGLGLHLTLQQTVVLDDGDYRSAVGEHLRYRLILLGLSFTI